MMCRSVCVDGSAFGIPALLCGDPCGIVDGRRVDSHRESAAADPEDIDGVRRLVPVAVEPDLAPSVGEFAGCAGPFVEVIDHSMDRAELDPEYREQIGEFGHEVVAARRPGSRSR